MRFFMSDIQKMVVTYEWNLLGVLFFFQWSKVATYLWNLLQVNNQVLKTKVMLLH